MVAPPEASTTDLRQQYYPDIGVTVDHDDNNLPTSLDYIQQYGKCKTGVLRPNQWFKYKCHPTTNIQLYRSATTGYAIGKNTLWLDVNQLDIPYYGVKSYIDAGAMGNQTVTYNFEGKAYVVWEFKNSH